MTSPVVEQHGRFFVVRDDIHPGGTKQVILRQWLPELRQEHGHTHFVYAASAFGKGGAALAFACAELGYKATLFMPRPSPKLSADIVWIDAVQKTGAEIIFTDPMPHEKLDGMALRYARKIDARYLVPGFPYPAFQETLMAYARSLPMVPTEIWCPVVSGSLAYALEAAFPEAALKPVSVVQTPGYEGDAELLFAQEKFIRRVAVSPPYPSWPYSDAKIWQLAKKHGTDGALIWNSNG